MEKKRGTKGKAEQEKTSEELLRYAFLVNLPGADPKTCSAVYQNEECYCMVAGVDGAEMGKCFAQELMEQGYLAIDLGSDFPAEAVLQIREMAEMIDLERMAELADEVELADGADAADVKELVDGKGAVELADGKCIADEEELANGKDAADVAELADREGTADAVAKTSESCEGDTENEKCLTEMADAENGTELVGTANETELVDEAAKKSKEMKASKKSEEDSLEAAGKGTEAFLAQIADEADAADEAMKVPAGDKENKASEKSEEDENSEVSEEDEEIKKIRIGHAKYTLDGLIALDFTRSFGKCGIIIVAGGVAQSVEMVLKNKKRDVHIAFAGNIRQAKNAATKMLEKRVAYIELSYWFDRMRLDSVVRAVGGKIAVGTCGDLTMQDLVDYPSDEPVRVTVNDRKR